MLVPIDAIIPDPNQPRKTFNEKAIKDLAASFDKFGVITPIKVRHHGDGRYMIVVGEMRWRAAKERGDKFIDVGPPLEIGDRQAREMQLIENLQRNELSHEEIGMAFSRYLKENLGVSQNELARRLGKSPAYVNDHCLFHANLSSQARIILEKAKLPYADKREVAAIKDVKRQIELAKAVVKYGIVGDDIPRVVAQAKQQLDRPIEDIIHEAVYNLPPRLVPTLTSLYPRHTLKRILPKIIGSILSLVTKLSKLEKHPEFKKRIRDFTPNLLLISDELRRLAEVGARGMEDEAKD